VDEDDDDVVSVEEEVIETGIVTNGVVPDDELVDDEMDVDEGKDEDEDANVLIDDEPDDSETEIEDELNGVFDMKDVAVVEVIGISDEDGAAEVVPVTSGIVSVDPLVVVVVAELTEDTELSNVEDKNSDECGVKVDMLVEADDVDDVGVADADVDVKVVADVFSEDNVNDVDDEDVDAVVDAETELVDTDVVDTDADADADAVVVPEDDADADAVVVPEDDAEMVGVIETDAELDIDGDDEDTEEAEVLVSVVIVAVVAVDEENNVVAEAEDVVEETVGDVDMDDDAADVVAVVVVDDVVVVNVVVVDVVMHSLTLNLKLPETYRPVVPSANTISPMFSTIQLKLETSSFAICTEIVVVPIIAFADNANPRTAFPIKAFCTIIADKTVSRKSKTSAARAISISNVTWLLDPHGTLVVVVVDVVEDAVDTSLVVVAVVCVETIVDVVEVDDVVPDEVDVV